MASRARMTAARNGRSLFLFGLILFVLTNAILFRKLLVYGKVPVAFDYGVYNYQPWKSEYEDKFRVPPKPIGHDDIRIFYPQRKFITELLKQGEIPFWNPYQFVGNPSLANSQTATFYPPFLLFLVLPQIVAWSLIAFFTPLMVAVGMFLFLSRLVGHKAALFGAVVFAWSSAVVVRIEDGLVAGQSLLWLPWVLYGLELVREKRERVGAIIAYTALTMSVLAGWFQFTFYVFAIGLIYVGARWSSDRGRPAKDLAVVGTPFLMSIATTAFHWLPALEALRYSPRGVLGTPEEFISTHLMPLTHLITLVIPDLFGHIGNSTYFGASEYKEGVVTIGIIPLLFALDAVRRKSWRGTTIGLFAGLALVGMILGTDNPIARAVIAINLPLVSTFLPNRILVVTTFSLSVLAAYGFLRLVNGSLISIRSLVRVSLRFFMAFYIAMAAVFLYEKLLAPSIGVSLFQLGVERYLRIAIRESILPLISLLVVFTFLRWLTNHTFVLILVFLTTLVVGMVRADRYLYFSSPENGFPSNPIFSYLSANTMQGRERFVTLSYSRIPSNIPSYYGVFLPEGVDALYPIWYGEFAGFFEGRDIETEDVLRIETTFAEELERRRWEDPKTINLLSHLGVRYLIVPQDATHLVPPEPAFTKVFAHQWHTVYEYNYRVPRAYFVPNASVSENQTVTLQRIFHPLFFDREEMVISQDDDPLSPILLLRKDQTVSNFDLVVRQRETAEALKEDPFLVVRTFAEKVKQIPVTINEYAPSRVVLEVEAPQAGYLVVSDSFFPGWKAVIDAVPVKVLRVNHAFRGVEVPAGKHTIIFTYAPDSFRTGMTIAVASTALLLVSLLMFATIRTGKARRGSS